jgi:hypothetical protein
MHLSDSTAIARERLIGLALFAAAVLGPWLLLLVIVARTKKRRLGIFGIGVVPAMLISLAGLFVSFCWYPGPPGAGARATAAKRRGASVLGALAEFKKDQGLYPDSLKALTPHLLSDTSLAAFPRLLGYPLEYTTSSDRRSFSLLFRYTGPGMNWCSWTDTSTAWRCGGYF